MEAIAATSAGVSTTNEGISADQLLRRLAQMKTERQPIESVLRECYEHTYPLRGTRWQQAVGTQGTLSTGLAQVNQALLLDSTGTESTRILGSALMSGLTPANSRWAESWIEHADDADKQWLDENSTTVWQWIHRSNFDAAAFECMIDVVVGGMCALFIDEASAEDGGGYTFEQWPLACTWFAASKRAGPVDTFFREMVLTAEQAVEFYGENMVDQSVRDAAKVQPDKTFVYIWCIYPRNQKQGGRLAQSMPVASVHVEQATKRIVRESGYHECPIAAPRWQLIPESVYANGPVFEALPSIKQLNQVIRLNMAGLEMNVAGMWIAKDDGVLNPNTVKVGPRKIIIAADTESMKPLISATDMSKTIIEIERLQKQIKGCMMADHLEPQTKPGDQETAYAVHVRVELIRQLLGPTYGRLTSEWLQRIWQRCWALAYRSGELGMAPPNLRGQIYAVKYLGPMARAQRGADLSAMDRYEASTLAQSQMDPNVIDNYDMDEANRLRAELGGVPSKLIRKKEDVTAMRAKAHQDQQQQQSQAMGNEALLSAVKGAGGDGNGMAMAALAHAMSKPKQFQMKGRQIVGIQ